MGIQSRHYVCLGARYRVGHEDVRLRLIRKGQLDISEQLREEIVRMIYRGELSVRAVHSDNAYVVAVREIGIAYYIHSAVHIDRYGLSRCVHGELDAGRLQSFVRGSNSHFKDLFRLDAVHERDDGIYAVAYRACHRYLIVNGAFRAIANRTGRPGSVVRPFQGIAPHAFVGERYRHGIGHREPIVGVDVVGVVSQLEARAVVLRSLTFDHVSVPVQSGGRRRFVRHRVSVRGEDYIVHIRGHQLYEESYRHGLLAGAYSGGDGEILGASIG